jgi:hypothetical protein
MITGYTTDHVENEHGVIFTPKQQEEGKIKEFPTINEEPITDEPNVSSILTPEEIAKFGPAPEENTEGLPGEKPKELTEEEKHAIFIQQLKESKIRFHPKRNGIKTTTTTIITPIVGTYRKIRKEKSTTILTNVTTNQFSADYRKKRKIKNRMARASRKANR